MSHRVLLLAFLLALLPLSLHAQTAPYPQNGIPYCNGILLPNGQVVPCGPTQQQTTVPALGSSTVTVVQQFTVDLISQVGDVNAEAAYISYLCSSSYLSAENSSCSFGGVIASCTSGVLCLVVLPDTSASGFHSGSTYATVSGGNGLYDFEILTSHEIAEALDPLFREAADSCEGVLFSSANYVFSAYLVNGRCTGGQP